MSTLIAPAEASVSAKPHKRYRAPRRNMRISRGYPRDTGVLESSVYPDAGWQRERPCIACSAGIPRVIDSRETIVAIRRRRSCLECIRRLTVITAVLASQAQWRYRTPAGGDQRCAGVPGSPGRRRCVEPVTSRYSVRAARGRRRSESRGVGFITWACCASLTRCHFIAASTIVVFCDAPISARD